MARAPTEFEMVSPMRQNKQMVKDGDRNTQLSSEPNIYHSLTTAHSDKLSNKGMHEKIHLGASNDTNFAGGKINTSSSVHMNLSLAGSKEVSQGELINLVD